MSEFDYKTFTSRNYLYISEELQEKISSTKIAFFGTGLSSYIAEQSSRLGFMNIHLSDGDKVELSNLNRQAFSIDHVNQYKSLVLKQKMLAINPLSNITHEIDYVDDIDDIKDVINSSDIIINTIDCNRTYFDLIEYSRLRGKLVICPFNPGFSGLVLNFTKDSASVYNIFDLEKELDDFEISKQLFQNYPQLKTLKEANSTSESFLNNAKASYFPQIIIGASITCGMVLSTIVNYLNEKPIIKMPTIFLVDFH